MRFSRYLLLALVAHRLAAQSETVTHSPGAMMIRVVDASGAPLSGAEIELPMLDVKFAVPDGGTLLINHVPAATYVVQVRRIGYAMQARVVSVRADTANVRFALERSAVALDTVSVVAPLVISDFERRLKARNGHFFTANDIAKSNSVLLSEFLGRIANMHCSANPSVFLDGVPINSLEGSDPARYLRALAPPPAPAPAPRTTVPTSTAPSGTTPAGTTPAAPRQTAAALSSAASTATPNPLRSSGALPPFDINSIALSQIAAMEVYPGQAPPELHLNEVSQKQCGTVLLWSKPKGG